MVKMSLAEALELQKKISDDPVPYVVHVYERLKEYCPQISTANKMNRARSEIQELGRRLLVHDHYNLSPETLRYLDENMLLFEDFISYEGRTPLLAECQALRLSEREQVIVWIVAADSMEISFPDGTTEVAHAGLKILEHPLAGNETVTLTAVFYFGATPASLQKSLDKQSVIVVSAGDYYWDLLTNWLDHYGISYAPWTLPLGEFFDGTDVSNKPFRTIEETEYNERRDECGVYQIIPEPPLHLTQELVSTFGREYGIPYETLAWLWRYLPSFISPNDEEMPYYTPILNSDFRYVERWATDPRVNPIPIPFQLVKEFLLRMRLEFGSFSLPLNLSPPIDMYNGRQTLRTVALLNEDFIIGGSEEAARRRQVELGAYYHWIDRGCPEGDCDVDWYAAESSLSDVPPLLLYTALSSNTFWRLLEEMDNAQPGAALAALKRLFLNEQHAEDLYMCWCSQHWDEFFERFLYLGWQAETVCRNTRKIVHLSDLHIGKNDEDEEAEGARRLVNGLVSTYDAEYPKPLVVITGDIVDYGSREHLETAREILKPLCEHGFLVLSVAGNHDYSDALNVAEISPMLLVVPVIREIFMGLVAWMASERGYRWDRITGLNLDGGAVDRFREWQRDNFLPNWSEGRVYLHQESYLKPQRSIRLTLLDNQDLKSDPPWWAHALLVEKGMFLHNEDMRYALGYVWDQQVQEVNDCVLKTLPGNLVVLCTHNWMDYHVRWVQPNAEQQLTTYVLDLAQTYHYDGGQVPDEGLYANSIRSKLFKLVIRNALLPAEELKAFCDALAQIYGGYGAFDYDTYAHLYGEREFPVKRGSNPTKDGEHDTHAITNEGSLFRPLDKSHLLLVGHRHAWTSHQLLSELRAGLEHVRDELVKYIPLQNETSKERIEEFLLGIKYFRRTYTGQGGYINIIKHKLIKAIAELVVSCDLVFDAQAMYERLAPDTMRYYIESGPSTREVRWLELSIDLRTGAVEKKDIQWTDS